MHAAIVGAGLAGLAAARALRRLKPDATLDIFDKGRGPGGRLATRRAELPSGRTLRFNHGAPAVHGRSPAFRDTIDSLARTGAAKWTSDHAAVGLPAMNAIVAAMARDLPVRFETRVAAIEPAGDQFRLREPEQPLGAFDRVILAIPAPQAAELARPIDPDLAEKLDGIAYAPAWSLMLAPAEEPSADELPGDSQLIDRLLRTETGAWTACATPDWSRDNLELSPDDAARALAAAAARLHPAFADLRHAAAHRWRYARVAAPSDQPYLIGASGRILCCGDAFAGPETLADADAAVSSGRAAAQALAAR